MKLFAMLLVFAWMGAAHAADVAPTCLGNGQILNNNNAQVIQWKQTSPNEYLNRGHVSGKVTAIYPNETGHNHFEITLDGPTPDTLEVIYDIKFGALPTINQGDVIEACGDYITSNAPYQSYPVSPDGALIHWIHRTDTASHDAGFLIINGVVYGQN